MNSLFLTGMPGAGKSTIGRRLAEFLDIAFYDTDELIEKRVGMKIPAIFKKKGEGYFRQKEKETLRELVSSDENKIVSTGGGILEDNENRHMLKDEDTVYIKVPLDELKRRVLENPVERPLVRDDTEKRMEDLFGKRRPLFEAFETIMPDISQKTEELLPVVLYQITGKTDFSVGIQPFTIDGVQTITFAPFELFKRLGKLADLSVIPERVEQLYGGLIASDFFTLPNGEAAKDLKQLERLWKVFIGDHITRKHRISALGGGTITDITGFAASTYKRGLPFVSFPTTLLAQVDAAIGGKNGINLEGVKNVCGTFYFPEEVIIDPLVTVSNSQESLKDGIVEGLKAALLVNKDEKVLQAQLNRAKELRERLRLKPLNDFIVQAVNDKMEIVNMDPYEKDIRKFLNLGHTRGHVYETTYGLSHGRAVALGMIESLGPSRDKIIRKYIDLLREFAHTDLDILNREWDETMREKLQNDKKNTKTSIVYVTLDSPGNPRIVERSRE